MRNFTAGAALNLTFNEQSAVIAVAFVLSLLTCAILAGIVFGALRNVNCSVLPLDIDLSDWACCVFFTYVAYKWCPTCCSGWRRRWQMEIDKMRQTLDDVNQVEMQEFEVHNSEEQERTNRDGWKDFKEKSNAQWNGGNVKK